MPNEQHALSCSGGLLHDVDKTFRLARPFGRFEANQLGLIRRRYLAQIALADALAGGIGQFAVLMHLPLPQRFGSVVAALEGFCTLYHDKIINTLFGTR